MKIREAEYNDLECIMDIYDRARKYMIANENSKQWGNGYPRQELLQKDIKEKHCYVCVDQDIVLAVFILIYGKDETYATIENGTWLNDYKYATIHRLASSGKVNGIANACIEWCKNQYSNLRADTHEDNKVMQHVLKKNGFIECGTIYVKDGTKRIAYQLFID